MTSRTLEPHILRGMNLYRRAANDLVVGRIHRDDNTLRKRPLALSDVKPPAVGHGGTTPGQNFASVHLNLVIREFGLDRFSIAGLTG